MATINDILNSKGRRVYCVSPDQSVKSALELMADQQIGAVVVMNGDEIVGIFSERDFARKTLSIDTFHLDLPVRELMTTPVYFVHADHSIESCMNLMTEKRIRHVPVLSGERLLGMVSIRDVVKWLIADKTFVIHELEQFISSRPEGE
jgi:CBS domain-containing protein